MNYVYGLFVFAALALIDCLTGGTRLIFALPPYTILAAGGVLTLVSAFRSRPAPNAPCLLSTFLLCAYLLTRCRFSPIPYLSRPDFFMIIGSLLVYLLVAFYANNPQERLLLVAGILLIAVPELYAGLMQFFKGRDFMLFGFRRFPFGTRASGMFISPNHFAGFLEAAGVLGVAVAAWSRWPLWAKGLIGYLSVGCYVGVAISGSRGGYLSVTFSILVFAALSLGVIGRYDRRLLGRATLFVLVAVALFLGGALFFMLESSLMTERLNHLFSKEVPHLQLAGRARPVPARSPFRHGSRHAPAVRTAFQEPAPAGRSHPRAQRLRGTPGRIWIDGRRTHGVFPLEPPRARLERRAASRPANSGPRRNV